MGRLLGQSKTGGRKKGTLNRRTEEFLDLLDSFDYDPIKKILEKYGQLSKSEQLRIDLKLLEFVYPKLKEQSLMLEEGDHNKNRSLNDDLNMIFTIEEKMKVCPETKEKVTRIMGNHSPNHVVQMCAEFMAEFLK